MKKIVFIMMAMLMAVIPSTAQNYKYSKYYNQKTGHLDYGFNNKGIDTYYGIRIGPGFSYVTSDDSRLDGGDWQTGLNVGVVAGFPLTYSDPLYLETGLYYIEKGGKKSLGGGKKMTYDLNYLEIPVVVKYKYEIDDDLTIEPFAKRQLPSPGWRSPHRLRYRLRHVLCRPHLRPRSCQHLPRYI